MKFRRPESVEKLIKEGTCFLNSLFDFGLGSVKLIEERHRSDKPSKDYIKTRFLGKVS